MGPTYLFLDTEWADVMGSELVSIALVSEDGEREFYAERDPLPSFATDFVRHAVYPSLDRGTVAMSDAEMTTALRRFLFSIRQSYVLADYPIDLQLLKYVLAGFDLPDEHAAACGPIPSPVMTLMGREGLTTVLLEDWFAAHPEQAKRRHNALVDARALRMAWMAATGRIDPHWSKLRS
ncbi:3'-5' exoribonuclease [Lysobacter sp. MMG2]|nr:3'-5' exoribonuclease [Lysobacter sp. MMG2]